MMNSKSISTTNAKRPYNLNNNDDSDIPSTFSDLQISSSMFSFWSVLFDCQIFECWNIMHMFIINYLFYMISHQSSYIHVKYSHTIYLLIIIIYLMI